VTKLTKRQLNSEIEEFINKDERIQYSEEYGKRATSLCGVTQQ